MQPSYRVVRRVTEDPDSERKRLIEGLTATRPSLSPKYFYDELGCALYGAICQLPEYYPTRIERSIFETHRDAIAQTAGENKQFVDLGAGDCRKAQDWFPFVLPRRYLAVDIAGPEIESALARLSIEVPDMELLGVEMDFSASLDLNDLLTNDAATFFYPGSSIGNFAPAEALAFLLRIFALCATRPGSGLLIGVDAKKPVPTLVAAYDDALGVTAAFNRNVLLHLNRRFGFDFDLNGFCHRGLYNEAEGRIEMHLESLREQVVSLGAGHHRSFRVGERIHTENSYKYTATEFADLLAKAGFSDVSRWTDRDEQFNVFYAR
ncbi:MAG: L-histidine N(alpha)-methyltransferase [Burkholderiales bacterium]|nr:L-histidine N(alpha)-methyltransferase [Burkholderiales bacterium]